MALEAGANVSSLDEEREKAAQRKKERDEQKAKEARKMEARQEGRVWGKADLMKGVGEVTEQYFDRIGAFIPMRRLDEGEAGDLDEYNNAGVEMTVDPDNTQKRSANIDPKVAAQGRRYAAQLAVSKSLSVNGEEWTVEDVKSLDNVGLVADIAERVYEMSGITEEVQEEIKSVRSDGGGGDAGVPGDERDAAGTPDVEDDTGTELVHAGSGSESGSEATGG